MNVIEEYQCDCKKDLDERERYHIKKCKPTLNKVIPLRTKKEYNKDNKEKTTKQQKIRSNRYREQNKDKIAKQKKEYQQKNREKIKQYEKEYAEKNKDKIKQQKKEYREQNKEKIKEKKKREYEKNKQKLLTKIKCPYCDKHLAKCSLKRHLREACKKVCL